MAVIILFYFLPHLFVVYFLIHLRTFYFFAVSFDQSKMFICCFAYRWCLLFSEILGYIVDVKLIFLPL